jgi:hypothetical protein
MSPRKPISENDDVDFFPELYAPSNRRIPILANEVIKDDVAPFRVVETTTLVEFGMKLRAKFLRTGTFLHRRRMTFKGVT